MKVTLSLSVLFSFSSFAQNITSIKADFSCEQPGGIIAFKVPTAKGPAKVWQADIGDTKGLELKVTDFQTKRCLGCYSFKALLSDVQIRGTVQNFLLKYEAYDEDSKSWEVLAEKIVCHKIK